MMAIYSRRSGRADSLVAAGEPDTRIAKLLGISVMPALRLSSAIARTGGDHGNWRRWPATQSCLVNASTRPSSTSSRVVTRRGLHTRDGQPGARLSRIS